MVSYYLIKFDKNLSKSQKEIIFNALNKIYDDDNRLIDFMELTINDLLKV